MIRRRFLHAKSVTVSTAAVILLVIGSPAKCCGTHAEELDLKTERVIVFKDGYSLVIKRATATTNAKGEVFTDEVPDAAVLGSFWAVPDEGRLMSMIAGWKTTTNSRVKELPCTQPIEILFSNKGKQAKVELHDKTIQSGVIHEVLVEQTKGTIDSGRLDSISPAAFTSPSRALSSRAAHAARLDASDVHTLSSISGASFILRTEAGDVWLPVGQIRSLVIKDMKATLAHTLATTRKAKRLTFQFDGPQKRQSMRLMYFRPGVRWIPTYRVQLTEDSGKKVGLMSLQAELLDEAEDFVDVPIDIVVGVPNFRFRNTPSPFTLEATLRNALAEAAPQLMGTSNSLSNAMYTQRSGEFRVRQANSSGLGEGGVVALPDDLTAAGSQDLFVYNLPKLTLAKGQLAAVPIFSAQAPYRDIYTWDVRVTRQKAGGEPSGSNVQSPLSLSKNEVWHQILLTNGTKLPWTTGAAMIMQGNQPLAQELLTYTPPKDDARVPLTVSVDVRGSLTEKEVGRDLKSLSWDGYNYARINKELKLDLCNNKSIEIETEITLRLGGKVEQASHNGSAVLGDFDQADWVGYQGRPEVNNSSVVTWKVKLKPGETFTPTVDYYYFVRH